jgi:hypothetical protein
LDWCRIRRTVREERWIVSPSLFDRVEGLKLDGHKGYKGNDISAVGLRTELSFAPIKLVLGTTQLWTHLKRKRYDGNDETVVRAH